MTNYVTAEPCIKRQLRTVLVLYVFAVLPSAAVCRCMPPMAGAPDRWSPGPDDSVLLSPNVMPSPPPRRPVSPLGIRRRQPLRSVVCGTPSVPVVVTLGSPPVDVTTTPPSSPTAPPAHNPDPPRPRGRRNPHRQQRKNQAQRQRASGCSSAYRSRSRSPARRSRAHRPHGPSPADLELFLGYIRVLAQADRGLHDLRQSENSTNIATTSRDTRNLDMLKRDYELVAQLAASERGRKLEIKLSLAIGAPVMLRTNAWTEAGLVNGALGTVRAIVYKPDARPQIFQLPSLWNSHTTSDPVGMA